MPDESSAAATHPDDKDVGVGVPVPPKSERDDGLDIITTEATSRFEDGELSLDDVKSPYAYLSINDGGAVELTADEALHLAELLQHSAEMLVKHHDAELENHRVRKQQRGFE